MKKILSTFTFIIVFGLAVNSAQAEHVMHIDKAFKRSYKKYDNVQSKRITFTPDQAEYLEQNADISFTTSHYKSINQHVVYKDGKIIGYTYEDTVIGKWGPIHYAVMLDTEGQIIKTNILAFYEIRGRPAMKRRFLKQYRDKSIADPVQLRQDIDGVSGATITSRSLTDGVRKILHVHHLLNVEKNN